MVLILSPFVAGLLGLFVLAIDFPNLLTLLGGATLIGCGWMLRPRANKNTEITYRRNDLPALFELCDSIAKKLGAPKIEGIHINDEFNAYMGKFKTDGKDEHILGIGAILWHAANHQEKIGVIGHEFGHLINGDCVRSGVTAKGFLILSGWIDLFTPRREVADDGAIYGEVSFTWEILLLHLRLITEISEWILETLIYAQSQRAEYLADAKSVEVAGKFAPIEMLKLQSRGELISRRANEFHFSPTVKTPIFAPLAEAMTQASDDDVVRLLQKMEEAELTVDSTHPPTKYRISFWNA